MAYYSFDGAFGNLNSAIDGVRKGWDERDKRQSLANLGQKIKAGDFDGAAEAAIAAGDAQTGIAILGLGQKAKDRSLEQEWIKGSSGGGMSLPGLGKQGGLGASPAGGPSTAAPRVFERPVQVAETEEDTQRLEADMERRSQLGYGNPNLPAGMRNNNPGNIKFVSPRQAPGVLGPSQNTDQGDPQAVFNSPEAGMAAAYDLAVRKYQGGKRTALDLIAGQGGWTPGNTAAAANIARGMGISPTDDLRLDTPERAQAFMRALIAQEHGKSGGRYDDGMIRTAVTGQSRQAPVQVAEAPASAGGPQADLPAPGAVPAQGFAIPPGTSPQQAQSLSADPGVQRAMQRLQTAPSERTRAIAKQELDVALADAKARTEGGKPTDVQRNYEVARRQGYQGTLLDYQKELRAQTTIKNEPAPPTGYRYIRDGEGNIERAEPIPGSKAAQDAEAAASKQQKAERIRGEIGTTVGNALDDIDRLMKTSWLPTTGGLGSITSAIKGTAAHDISQALTTVGANISFQQLQQMREASPTGGALGAVSDTEQKMLQNSYAALSQSQSAEQFKTNLGRTRAVFERIVHGRTLNPQERKTGGPMTMERAKALREEASQAIAGGADRAAVARRLKEDYGITPEGL